MITKTRPCVPEVRERNDKCTYQTANSS